MKYSWDTLEVGDAHFIKGDPSKIQAAVFSSAYAWGKKQDPKIKFSTERVRKGLGSNGVRVTRIE